ncbi:MAG TPA: ElyC/SanA/YdcF family protein [Terriglobia bacterium]|nr:ElyC/SanA/YdcF family protein [Terriglobia bacterium]
MKVGVAAVVIACLLAAVLRFGGELLVRSGPLPAHAQVAVALNGSIAGVLARTSEAVRLLKSGIVDNVIVSIPPKGYWGESIPAEANDYFTKHFGPAVAARIFYCVSSADSTIEEAHAIEECLKAIGWTSVVIVTSNFHSRRAGRIWRAELAKANSPVKLNVDGVADGSFEPRGWWRKRVYAKTWLLETSKLVWETFFGLGPWPGAMPSGTLETPPGSASSESSPLGRRYKN